ncbi:MAG: hypothetical protein ACRDRN_16420 [Sciscionella sp.]
MSGRAKRLVAASGVALAMGACGAVLTAGTASAATPIVLGSCNATINGAPGTPLSLNPNAVLNPVVNTVSAVPILGPPLAGTVQGILTSMPNIPIGAIPNGTGAISGATIAHDVTSRIPVLGPVLGQVTSTLTNMCGITMHGLNTVAGTAQDGTNALANAAQRAFNPGSKSGGQPGTPGGGDPGKQGDPGTSGNPGTAPGATQGTPPPLAMPSYQGLVGTGVPFNDSLIAQYGTALSPQQRYGNIPFAMPGLFSMSPGVRYGGEIPGYAPQVQALGAQQGDANNPVRTAGRAEALPGGGLTDGTVGLPLLLAVLGFAGVSAALVRTWVLRKSLGTTA